MCVELNSKAREKEDVFREKPKKPKKKKSSRERDLRLHNEHTKDEPFFASLSSTASRMPLIK
jgi:hypothetical protein